MLRIRLMCPAVPESSVTDPAFFPSLHGAHHAIAIDNGAVVILIYSTLSVIQPSIKVQPAGDI